MSEFSSEFVARLSLEEMNIHERAGFAAQAFRRAEAELVEALIAVGEAKVYLRLGYPSLFRYVTEELELSEAVAYCAISVARKAADVPALRAAIGSGALPLSKAKKVLSVLDPRGTAAEQEGWVEKAVTLSSRKIERAVARENPLAATSERATYKSAQRVELTLGISEMKLLEFRRVQDLESTRKGTAVSLEETLGEVLEFYLARRDPERRARRVIAKKGSDSQGARVEQFPSEQFPGTVGESTEGVEVGRDVGLVLRSETASAEDRERRLEPVAVEKKTREPIPARLEHQVRLRDRSRCQAKMPDGRACGATRWLEIHHRVPVSEGGENHLENLTLLCRAHHQSHHSGRLSNPAE